MPVPETLALAGTTTTAVTVLKSTAAAGVGVLLAELIYDAEFMILVATGVFSATTSYFYDWVHRDPRHLGLRELSEFIKFLLYGTSLMFVVYYLGVNHGSEYLDLPKTAWGFIAAISAGSAVTIVDWIAPCCATLAKAIAEKFFGVKS